MAAGAASKARSEANGSSPRRVRGARESPEGWGIGRRYVPPPLLEDDYEALAQAVRAHEAVSYNIAEGANPAPHDRELYRALFAIEQRRERLT
jgi:hypothetical protein